MQIRRRGLLDFFFLLATLTLITFATPSHFYSKATPQLGYCIEPFHCAIISLILSEQIRVEKRDQHLDRPTVFAHFAILERTSNPVANNGLQALFLLVHGRLLHNLAA